MRPLAALLACWVGTAAALMCPPVGFDSAYDLDVARFFGGVWHVQLQVGLAGGDGLVWNARPAARCAAWTTPGHRKCGLTPV